MTPADKGPRSACSPICSRRAPPRPALPRPLVIGIAAGFLSDRDDDIADRPRPRSCPSWPTRLGTGSSPCMTRGRSPSARPSATVVRGNGRSPSPSLTLSSPDPGVKHGECERILSSAVEARRRQRLRRPDCVEDPPRGRRLPPQLRRRLPGPPPSASSPRSSPSPARRGRQGRGWAAEAPRTGSARLPDHARAFAPRRPATRLMAQVLLDEVTVPRPGRPCGSGSSWSPRPPTASSEPGRLPPIGALAAEASVAAAWRIAREDVVSGKAPASPPTQPSSHPSSPSPGRDRTKLTSTLEVIYWYGFGTPRFFRVRAREMHREPRKGKKGG